MFDPSIVGFEKSGLPDLFKKHFTGAYMLSLLVLLVISSNAYHAGAQPWSAEKHSLATSWIKLITQKAKQDQLSPPPSLRLYAYAGIVMHEYMVANDSFKPSVYKKVTGQDLVSVNKKITIFQQFSILRSA